MDYMQNEYILEPCPIKVLSHYFCRPVIPVQFFLQKWLAGWQNILTEEYAMVLFINLSECVLLRYNTMFFAKNNIFQDLRQYIFWRQ